MHKKITPLGLMIATTLQFLLSPTEVLASVPPKISSGKTSSLKPLPSSSAQQLKEILAYVYNNSSEIASARIDVRMADEGVNQAKTGLRPHLSASAGQKVSRTKESHNGPYPGANIIDHNPNASVQLSHRLFDFGATEASITQADKAVLAARFDLVNAVQNAFLEAIKAIITIKQSQTTIAIRQDAEKDILVILDQTRTKHLVGIENQAAVELAVANFEQAKAAVTQAKGQLEQAKAEYLYATKMEAPHNLQTPPLIEQLPKSLEQLQALALKNNPGILSAQYKLEGALEAIDAAKRDVKPSINVSGNASRNIHGNNTEDPLTRGRYAQNNATIGIDLNVPLYQPQAYSQIRQAQEQSLKARKQLDLARLKIQQNCTSLWANLLTLEAEIRQIQASIVAQRENVRGSLEGKIVGTESVFEIIQKQQQLYSYMDQLNTKQAAYLQAQYQCLSLTGRLTAENLQLPVEIYNPEKNYEEFAGSWLAFKDKKSLELEQQEIPFDVLAELPPVKVEGSSHRAPLASQNSQGSKERKAALMQLPSTETKPN